MPAVADAVSKACHAAGLLTMTCGTYGNILRFLPPLVMPPETLAAAWPSSRRPSTLR